MQGIFCIKQIFDFVQIRARPVGNNEVRQGEADHHEYVRPVQAASSAGTKRRAGWRAHRPRHGPPDAAESLRKALTVGANRTADSRVWCAPAAAFAQPDRKPEQVVTIDVMLDGILVGAGMAGNIAAVTVAKRGMNVLRPGRDEESPAPSTTAHDPDKSPAFGKFARKQATTSLRSDRGYQLRRQNQERRSLIVPRGGTVRQPLSCRSRSSPYQRACAQRCRRSCFSRESQPALLRSARCKAPSTAAWNAACTAPSGAPQTRKKRAVRATFMVCCSSVGGRCICRLDRRTRSLGSPVLFGRMHESPRIRE